MKMILRKKALRVFFMFFCIVANAFADDSDISYERGMDAIRKGDYERAIAEFTIVVNSNDADNLYKAIAYYLRARAYQRLNKTPEYISDLQASIDVS